MTQLRDVHTCTRCRNAKRKCDKSRPRCVRCERAGVTCHYDDQSSESTSSPDSLFDDISNSPAPARVVKRRARACLSCTRCHRLKIKCDKAQPCSRCASSGHETACTYLHKSNQIVKKNGSATPFVLASEDPEFVVATWFLRRRGSSHWKALLDRLESLSMLDPFSLAMKEHIEGDCSRDFSLPGNFPFGTVESTRYVSLDKVQELLQSSQDSANMYVAKYFELYHAYLPVLDPPTFHLEVSDFQNAPHEADASWLALYLVVLGLGAYAATSDDAVSAEFLFASEACLAKTPYMFRPTTTNIITLCLMVFAKQAAYATCWALDTCWNVMGIVVRLSLITVLHQEWMPEFHDPSIIRERNTRRRLWTMVVFLDTQMSLVTGQQSLIPLDTLLTGITTSSPTTLEDCWDTLLPQAFPIICPFLARVNSTANPITYPDVLHYDTEIRRIMRPLASLPGAPTSALTLDIFFRRTLLILHRRHALDSNAPVLYPTSYWSSLECSLALLMHHRALSPSAPSPTLALLARPYTLDFFSAALTTCVHLMRCDAPLAGADTREETIPPRQTIRDTLTECLAILERDRSRSLCFSTGQRLLRRVFEMLPTQ